MPSPGVVLRSPSLGPADILMGEFWSRQRFWLMGGLRDTVPKFPARAHINLKSRAPILAGLFGPVTSGRAAPTGAAEGE